MTIWLPLLFAIVGLLMYALANTNPKIQEIGRIMFAFGLLAFLLHADQLVKIIP